MDSFSLYRTWFEPLVQLSPDGCLSRTRNLTWLIVGLYRAMSVHLSAIVRKWPLSAKNPSLWRRLERFLSNPAVRVRDWYEPVARQWFQRYGCLRSTIRLRCGTTLSEHFLGLNQRQRNECNHAAASAGAAIARIRTASGSFSLDFMGVNSQPFVVGDFFPRRGLNSPNPFSHAARHALPTLPH